ncbi:hypothetical protein CC1G_10977 [Coprinopsis cinerea okayama7|uniref:Uncharacterized protein n=1 Tax=Coprinopsis cinerea (strain Okayama-7 / 130 / ATCC MYA-4618 / FGSC 9003) TaxID=240176 RepID=A8PC26_COPC7|nr:hypothetical protein CC1G_10977 [Coprinopsis cinerea okayama7\|eukprot:XP_001840314.1 hypothetical protein CC1G_10977 [Coprinopsis cinerea okayama7\
MSSSPIRNETHEPDSSPIRPTMIRRQFLRRRKSDDSTNSSKSDTKDTIPQTPIQPRSKDTDSVPTSMKSLLDDADQLLRDVSRELSAKAKEPETPAAQQRRASLDRFLKGLNLKPKPAMPQPPAQIILPQPTRQRKQRPTNGSEVAMKENEDDEDTETESEDEGLASYEETMQDVTVKKAEVPVPSGIEIAGSKGKGKQVVVDVDSDGEEDTAASRALKAALEAQKAKRDAFTTPPRKFTRTKTVTMLPPIHESFVHQPTTTQELGMDIGATSPPPFIPHSIPLATPPRMLSRTKSITMLSPVREDSVTVHPSVEVNMLSPPRGAMALTAPPTTPPRIFARAKSVTMLSPEPQVPSIVQPCIEVEMGVASPEPVSPQTFVTTNTARNGIRRTNTVEMADPLVGLAVKVPGEQRRGYQPSTIPFPKLASKSSSADFSVASAFPNAVVKQDDDISTQAPIAASIAGNYNSPLSGNQAPPPFAPSVPQAHPVNAPPALMPTVQPSAAVDFNFSFPISAPSLQPTYQPFQLPTPTFTATVPRAPPIWELLEEAEQSRLRFQEAESRASEASTIGTRERVGRQVVPSRSASRTWGSFRSPRIPPLPTARECKWVRETLQRETTDWHSRNEKLPAAARKITWDPDRGLHARASSLLFSVRKHKAYHKSQQLEGYRAEREAKSGKANPTTVKTKARNPLKRAIETTPSDDAEKEARMRTIRQRCDPVPIPPKATTTPTAEANEEQPTEEEAVEEQRWVPRLRNIDLELRPQTKAVIKLGLLFAGLSALMW